MQLNLRYFYTSCALRVNPSDIRKGITSRSKGRFTLYITFPFRRGTSPFSKIFSCVVKRRCSHWQERLRHVSVSFRRVSVPLSHVSVPFRHVSGPFRHASVLSRHVLVPFRRRCWPRMFYVTERVRTGLNLPDFDNVNSPTSPPLHCDCLQRVLPVFLQKLMQN